MAGFHGLDVFLVELGLAERDSKNATVFFNRRSVAKRGVSCR